MITRSPGFASAADRFGHLVEPPNEMDGTGSDLPHRLRQGLDRDAIDRRLAGRVDIGQHDLVCASERLPELAQQVPCPGETVGLKDDDHAPIDACARGRDHGGDLGRVMTVVVDDQHARGFAAPFETALGAAERFERRGDPVERHVRLQTDRHGGQRIEQVVPAGHAQS